MKEKYREYRKRNNKNIKKSSKKWRDNNKEKIKEKTLKYKYGITMGEFEKILREQNNKCAICNIDFNNTKVCIDHCHQTNRIRGLLCNGCNCGIGFLKENIQILQNTMNYLRDKQ